MMLNVGGAGGGETCAYGDRLGALRRDVALAAPLVDELMFCQARLRYGKAQRSQTALVVRLRVGAVYGSETRWAENDM